MAANTKETRVCKPDRDFLLFQEVDQVNGDKHPSQSEMFCLQVWYKVRTNFALDSYALAGPPEPGIAASLSPFI